MTWRDQRKTMYILFLQIFADITCRYRPRFRPLEHYQHVFQQFVINASILAIFHQGGRTHPYNIPVYNTAALVSFLVAVKVFRARRVNTVTLAQSGVKFLHYVKRFI